MQGNVRSKDFVRYCSQDEEQSEVTACDRNGDIVEQDGQLSGEIVGETIDGFDNISHVSRGCNKRFDLDE